MAPIPQFEARAQRYATIFFDDKQFSATIENIACDKKHTTLRSIFTYKHCTKKIDLIFIICQAREINKSQEAKKIVYYYYQLQIFVIINNQK